MSINLKYRRQRHYEIYTSNEADTWPNQKMVNKWYYWGNSIYLLSEIKNSSSLTVPSICANKHVIIRRLGTKLHVHIWRRFAIVISKILSLDFIHSLATQQVLDNPAKNFVGNEIVDTQLGCDWIEDNCSDWVTSLLFSNGFSGGLNHPQNVANEQLLAEFLTWLLFSYQTASLLTGPQGINFAS